MIKNILYICLYKLEFTAILIYIYWLNPRRNHYAFCNNQLILRCLAENNNSLSHEKDCWMAISSFLSDFTALLGIIESF